MTQRRLAPAKRKWVMQDVKFFEDSRMKLLSFEDQRHYSFIYCMKGEGELDKDAPLLDRRVAVRLGLQPPQAEEAKRRIMEVGLIDKDWQPVEFDEQQPAGDTTAAERKARQRERERLEKEAKLKEQEGGPGVSRGVTRDRRDSHGPYLEGDSTDTKNPPTPQTGGGEGLGDSVSVDDEDTEGERETAELKNDEARFESAVLELVSVLHDEGGVTVETSSRFPREWVADGYTAAQLTAAIRTALLSKKVLNVGYVNAVLRNPQSRGPPNENQFEQMRNRMKALAEGADDDDNENSSNGNGAE